MNRKELKFGALPNYFLEETATEQDLFFYVKEFYEIFAVGSRGFFPTVVMTAGKESGVYASFQEDESSYYLAFYNGEDLNREYRVREDWIYCMTPSEDSDVRSMTVGHHAQFISAHLRTAAVIQLQEQGLTEA